MFQFVVCYDAGGWWLLGPIRAERCVTWPQPSQSQPSPARQPDLIRQRGVLYIHWPGNSLNASPLSTFQHFNNTRSMHRELFLRFFNKADISEWALRCGQRPKTSWHHRNSAWASLPDHAMTMTRATDQCNIMQCEVERSPARPGLSNFTTQFRITTGPGQCAYCPAPPISSGPGAVSVYTSYWGVVCRYQAPACV